MFFYVFIIWVSSTMILSDDIPYCSKRYNRLCNGKGVHVACQFPDPGPGPLCENYTRIAFTKDLQHFVLHYINRRRQRIASGNERVKGGVHLPKPQIMTLVEWDRELSFLAQKLADQCNFAHDECRATVRFPYGGQTVGEVRWRRSSNSEVLSARLALQKVFDAWWGERRRVEPKHLITPFKLTSKGAIWGHFSQLAIWNLRAIGCGAVRHGATHPRLLLVCDFSHTNMLGQRTLVPGPLAPCPPHMVRKPRSTYPFLCAPVSHPYHNEDHQTEEQYHDDSDEDMFTGPILKEDESQIVVSDKFKEDDDELFQVRAKATPVILDNLQRELQKKSKGLSMTSVKGTSEIPQFEKWRTVKPNTEEVSTAIRRIYVTEKIHNLFYSPIYRGDENEQNIRQRWKQTRVRPQRPGANALLAGSTVMLKPFRRQPAMSFMLDKEVVDQLFKDTGFKFTLPQNG